MLGLALSLPSIRNRGSNPNLLGSPAAFDDVYWSKVDTTVTTNTTAADIIAVYERI